MVSAAMIGVITYLTMDAVEDWKNNPISTLTEPQPIYSVKFPKITVCPPKVSFSFTFLFQQLCKEMEQV